MSAVAGDAGAVAGDAGTGLSGLDKSRYMRIQVWGNLAITKIIYISVCITKSHNQINTFIILHNQIKFI